MRPLFNRFKSSIITSIIVGLFVAALTTAVVFQNSDVNSNRTLTLTPTPSPSSNPTSSPTSSPTSPHTSPPTSTPTSTPAPTKRPLNNITSSPERAQEVKNAMKFAWDKYVEFAWGQDELKPISQKANNWYYMGLSIVDGADTLFLMNLIDEYNAARDWIATGPNRPTNPNIYVSMFEGNIRYLGAYLALHDLTNDTMYLQKAITFGNNLLRAFDNNVFPCPRMNFENNATQQDSCVPLAGAGSYFLEFHHLWEKSGLEVFLNHSTNMLNAFSKLNLGDPGFYPNKLYRDGSGFCGDEYTIAGSSDSFYEYLLKMTLYTSKTNHSNYATYQKLFKDVAATLIDRLWIGPTPQGDYYFDTIYGQSFGGAMREMGCFAGGMFSLSSVINATLDSKISSQHFEVGANLTKLCAKTYTSTNTGLGAEFTYFNVDGSFSFKTISGESAYPLRPEAIEALFYLYRFTGDTLYQDLGWEIFLSLNTSCRTEHGFSGLEDVNAVGSYIDTQDSFFLAETLKYLYLLFAHTSLIPLDEYIFNTEGHPFLIPQQSRSIV